MRHSLEFAGRFGLLAAALLTFILLALIVGGVAGSWWEDAEGHPAVSAPEAPRSS